MRAGLLEQPLQTRVAGASSHQIRVRGQFCGYFCGFIWEIHKKTFKILVHSVAGSYLCNPNQKIGFRLCLNESESNYNHTITIW